MRYNLGIAFHDMEKHEAALQEMRQAVEIKNYFPEAYFYMGRSLSKLGRHRDAIEAFALSIEQDGDFAPAHYELGNSCRRLAKTLPASARDRKLELVKKAIEALTKAHSLAPNIYPPPPEVALP